MTNNKLKKITAYHEAGHALLYHILGNQIQYMEINNIGDGFVKCEIPTPTAFFNCHDEGLDENLFKYGLVCLSGYLTEFRFQNFLVFQKSLYEYYLNNECTINDFGCLKSETSKANKVCGYDRYEFEFFESIVHQVWEIIQDKNCWKAISSLVKAVLVVEENHLNGKEVHRILSQYVKFGSKLSIDKNVCSC